MRMRLLLIFLVALSGMGADCGGGGGSNSGTFAAESSSVGIASNEGREDFAQPVPEPSAMLMFGVGLLVAGAATRRNR